MKTAFMFSGQGAQYPSMFQDIYKECSAARQVMELADQTLQRDITGLCFRGTQEELDQTQNTQPCVLACDLAAAAALMEKGIHPDGAAGFSLGEYAALTVAGVIRKEEVFPLIRRRADAMQAAAPAGSGAMAAIGLDGEGTEKLLMQAAVRDVEIANYNSPEQTVIAGNTEEVGRVVDYALAHKIRAVRLHMSVPSHCSFMRPAVRQMAAALDAAELSGAAIPVYMNYTGDVIRESDMRESILQQLQCPLQWVRTIETMYRDGFDVFIECGPGKTLMKLVKKILKGKDVNVFHVEDMGSLEETAEKVISLNKG